MTKIQPVYPRPAGGTPEETGRLDGWVTFAAVIIAVLATMNFIYGIAGVSKSKFFVGDAQYVISDLKTMGWVLILLAVGQLATAVGILAQWPGVRWVGVAFAGLNAIVQLLVMPAYPFWGITLFVLDVLVIYALLARWQGRP